jgi:topoisomerase-4 subunit A
MQRFELAAVQAEAILELKLRHLAKLEETKIQIEQRALKEERDTLQKILGSKMRLGKLIREELMADADAYGDARRSQLASSVPVAQALDATQRLASEPVTVVLSERGWVRAGRGHDLDPQSLTFRSGDAFRAAAYTRTNHTVAFLDSSGRIYNQPVHGLPSARGHGEPLSGRTDPPGGAYFTGLVGIEDAPSALLVTASGHGFVTEAAGLVTRNRAGKQVMTVSAGEHTLTLCAVPQGQGIRVALVTSAGYLLIVAVEDIPRLARGKGVRLIGIPPPARAVGEHLIGVAILGPDAILRIEAGQRHKAMNAREQQDYRRGRGKRGLKLPRGFQNVERILSA